MTKRQFELLRITLGVQNMPDQEFFPRNIYAASPTETHTKSLENLVEMGLMISSKPPKVFTGIKYYWATESGIETFRSAAKKFMNAEVDHIWVVDTSAGTTDDLRPIMAAVKMMRWVLDCEVVKNSETQLKAVVSGTIVMGDWNQLMDSIGLISGVTTVTTDI